MRFPYPSPVSCCCMMPMSAGEVSPRSTRSRMTAACCWAALRGLEEKASLVHRLAERARDAGHGMLADRYAEQGHAAQQHAAVIRDLVLRGDTSPADIGIMQQQETGDG
ncbi:MAG: hypothetical protein LC748_14355 [Thermomicrobia bacterium]|nr:hypothetical protein [Thermomicrobia bacterium]